MSKKIKKEDKSPKIHQKDKTELDFSIRDLNWTENQKKFIDIVLNKDTKLVIVDGVAGSSKSLLSVYCGLQLLKSKRVSDIVYIRSLIQSKDGETGFLSGSLQEKMYYYNLPFQDKLEELLDKQTIDKLVKEERFQTFPTSLIRGNSWNAKYVIADEMQNALFTSLFTIATRIGQFSKGIICGDMQQNDFGSKSGFREFYDLFNDDESKANGIHTFKFTSEDIVRSELVKYIVQKLEQKGIKAH